MNIARMEKFEQIWGLRHDLPAESLAQYRFESREGYRLPELAAHYRTFVEALESGPMISVKRPEDFTDGGSPNARILIAHHREIVKRWIDAIEAAGLKVAE